MIKKKLCKQITATKQIFKALIQLHIYKTGKTGHLPLVNDYLKGY